MGKPRYKNGDDDDSDGASTGAVRGAAVAMRMDGAQSSLDNLPSLEKKVDRVAASLHACQTLADEMTALLDGFEVRLSGLEASMLPIHEQTQVLSSASKHVVDASRQVERIRVHAALVNLNESDLDERAFVDDYKAYLDLTRRLHAALMYFERHARLTKADRATKVLSTHLKRSIRCIEKEFKTQLDRAGALPLDLWAVAAAVGDDDDSYNNNTELHIIAKSGGKHVIELLPDKVFARLSNMASCLDSCGQHSFVSQLVQSRSLALKSAVENACAREQQQHHQAVKGDHASVAAAVAGGIARRVKSKLRAGAINASSNKKGAVGAAEPYERGSHPILRLVRGAVRACEDEARMVERLLERGSSINAMQRHRILMVILNEPLALLRRHLSETMKRHASDAAKPLWLLDCLAYFNRHALPRLLRVLCAPSDVDDPHEQLEQQHNVAEAPKQDTGVSSGPLSSSASEDPGTLTRIELERMVDLWRSAVRQVLETQRVQLDPTTSRGDHVQVPIDGGIDATVVHTLTFLRQLTPYAATLDAVLDEVGDLKVPLDRNSAADLQVQSSNRSRHETRIGGSLDEKSNDLSGIFRAQQQQQQIQDQHNLARGSAGLTRVAEDLLRALEQALEHRMRHSYRNPCLAQVFHMNNLHYLAQHFDASHGDFIAVASPALLRRYDRLFQEARRRYRQVTWTKALDAISMDDAAELVSTDTHQATSSAARRVIKQKFTGFNSAFEELYSTQKQFSVPDPDLRCLLRNDNVELILPKYNAFLEFYGKVDFSSHPGTYIRYHANVLEQMLNNFFDESA